MKSSHAASAINHLRQSWMHIFDVARTASIGRVRLLSNFIVDMGIGTNSGIKTTALLVLEIDWNYLHGQKKVLYQIKRCGWFHEYSKILVNFTKNNNSKNILVEIFAK